MSSLIFLSLISACIVSIVRTYYTFKLVNSGDVTHNVVLLGFWSHAEIAIGIMISCFPVLPRLIQVFHSRARDAFSSRFKDSEMSFRETLTSRFSLASANCDRGKKSSGGLADPYHSRTENSKKNSPSQEQKSTQSESHSGISLSRESLMSTPDRSAPRGENRNVKQPQGHILMTTHIETEIESHANATHGSHTDIERQQLGW